MCTFMHTNVKNCQEPKSQVLPFISPFFSPLQQKKKSASKQIIKREFPYLFFILFLIKNSSTNFLLPFALLTCADFWLLSPHVFQILRNPRCISRQLTYSKIPSCIFCISIWNNTPEKKNASQVNLLLCRESWLHNNPCPYDHVSSWATIWNKHTNKSTHFVLKFTQKQNVKW